MERWLNRIAVITGAGAGIGAACVKYLVNNGMIVVGLDLNRHAIEALRNEVRAEVKDHINAIKCDVRNETEIETTFREIEDKYGPVAVLVNNAGILRNTTLLSADNSRDMRDVVQTNLMGVVHCTREAFRSMKASGGDGHIFLMNSISGHYVPRLPNTTINIYSPTKYAMTALTEVYRQELFHEKTKIKVTDISAGIVDTDMIGEQVRKLIPNMVKLKPDDIADALIYCLQTPPNVQIHELIIKPIGEIA